MGIILIVMIGVGVAERSGLIAVADPQAGRRPRPRGRSPTSSCSSASSPASPPTPATSSYPVGRGGLRQRRPASAGRHGSRVRGRRRRVRRQPPRDAHRRRPHGDHQRVDPARRPDAVDRPDRQPVVRHRLDDPAHRVAGGGHDAGWWRSVWEATTRRRPDAGAARSRPPTTPPRWTPRPSVGGCGCPGSTCSAPSRSSCCSPLPPGAPLRDPETGAIIGTSPFMNSLIVIITLLFLAAGIGYGRGAGTIRTSSRDDRRDHEVVGRARGAAAALPADRPVHRVLQLLEDAAGRGGEARRPDRASRHRRGLAAAHRDRDHARRRDHPPAGHRQVGTARADLHPGVPAPGRRARGRARGLPGRRLPDEHRHADHGLLPAHRGLRRPLRPTLRHRHGDRADAAVLRGPHRRVDRCSSSPGTCSGSPGGCRAAGLPRCGRWGPSGEPAVDPGADLGQALLIDRPGGDCLSGSGPAPPGGPPPGRAGAAREGARPPGTAPIPSSSRSRPARRPARP